MNTSIHNQDFKYLEKEPEPPIQNTIFDTATVKEYEKELTLMNEKNKEIIKRREEGDVEWLRNNLDKYHPSHPDYIFTMYGIMPQPKNINDNGFHFMVFD